MLWVYELMGEKHPRNIPENGLHGVWPEAPYYYLFYRIEALGPVSEWLKSNDQWELTSQYSLPYEKWQDFSVSQTKAGPFSIRMAPGFEDISTQSDEILLRIDPGVVFGSGLHPTTSGCLQAIAESFAEDEIRTAVDFGTGTGILAIACALLGVPRVWALDCNPLALKVAVRNAKANGVADRIGFLTSERLGVLNVRSDLLMMNLEWPILEAILRTGDWKKHDRVVLSGFLESRLTAVEEIVRAHFEVSTCRILEGWPIVSLVTR
jgi:ribosomal protein L11 methyltransferase